MYEIILTQHARRKLLKLDAETQKRIIAALERIRIRPEAHLSKLVDSPHYKLRVGDYRAIIGLEHGRPIVLVITIGHRKKIYKLL